MQRAPQQLFFNYYKLRFTDLTSNQVVGIVLEMSLPFPLSLCLRHIYSTPRQDRFQDRLSLQKASFVKSVGDRFSVYAVCSSQLESGIEGRMSRAKVVRGDPRGDRASRLVKTDSSWPLHILQDVRVRSLCANRYGITRSAAADALYRRHLL